MKNMIYLLFPALILGMLSFCGCKKDKDAFTVEGTVVVLVDPCDGNGILISVENIENFGKTGTLYLPSNPTNYENAILVPYFHKDSIKNSNLITYPLQAGDKLKFECRLATEDEYHRLFFYDGICTANHFPLPSSFPRYIITKFSKVKK
jgi:hypothetical protein